MEYRVKNCTSQAGVLAVCNALDTQAQGVTAITFNGNNYQVWYVVTPQRADAAEAAIATAFAKLDDAS